MRFTPTFIPQLFVVDLDELVDERGFFARAWCQRELADHELTNHCSQVNLAYNSRRGTLRGMHFQRWPHTDDKYIRMISGTAHDVVVDLRRDSPAYGRWFAMELDAKTRRGLFIPKGCAHGYLTLTDHAEMMYIVSAAYHRDSSAGLHWRCPLLQGAWPFEPAIVSDQDSRWPLDPPDILPRVAA